MYRNIMPAQKFKWQKIEIFLILTYISVVEVFWFLLTVAKKHLALFQDEELKIKPESEIRSKKCVFEQRVLALIYLNEIINLL